MNAKVLNRNSNSCLTSAYLQQKSIDAIDDVVIDFHARAFGHVTTHFGLFMNYKTEEKAEQRQHHNF